MHEKLSWELTLLSYLRAICSTFSRKTSSSPFPFWTTQSSFSCYPWTTFCSRRTGIASKTAGTLRTLMIKGENDSEIISKTSSRLASLKYFCWCPYNNNKNQKCEKINGWWKSLYAYAVTMTHEVWFWVLTLSPGSPGVPGFPAEPGGP